MILGLKIGRRLTAVAALGEEQFLFRDSRYAVKRRDVQLAAFSQYIQQVLEQVKPAAIYFYAPSISSESLADALVKQLVELAGQRGIPVRPLDRLDIFGSFGIAPIRTRHDLVGTMSTIWPDLTTAPVGRQPALAEAGAAALVGNLHQTWPPV